MAGDKRRARFAERLEAVGGHVHVATGVDEVVLLIAAFARERDTREVMASDELSRAHPALKDVVEHAGLSWRIPSGPADARDAPLGLSLGHLAVAETGSVLLAEATLADRAIGLMSIAQIVLCPASAIVPSLDDAAPVLRSLSANGAAHATLVTGPSRTADIERELTIGVQGPAEFTVVFINGI